MIDFKELKVLIQKASSVDKTDISSRFKFSVDVEKLEQLLNQKSDLHVIAGTQLVESRIPDFEDVQLVSEYVYKKEHFASIFNGSSQIATFLLYCDMNGSFSVGTDSETFTSGDIYAKLNTEDIDMDIMNVIVSDTPIYRVLVVRRFNTKEDKFDYAIFFRSNRNMINYIKDLKEDGKFDPTDDSLDEEKSE
jgi:hypothetical protein